jgi:hypothetical protein
MGFVSIGATGLGNKQGGLAVSKPWTKDAKKSPMVALAQAAQTYTPSVGYRTTANQQGAGFNTTRYAPNTEMLDRTSLMDDITPKSDVALMQLCEMIYQNDAVAGPSTDLISTLPWSDWSLSGIDDPAIMRIYEDAMEAFAPEESMPELTREYLMYGRFISSLLYDGEQGTWRGIIPHNPKYVTITPVPIRGFDPLLDLAASPEMKVFLDSKDKRLAIAKGMMPEDMMKSLKKGSYPLEPLSTLFVPRKVTSSDWKGSSMYLRILPYYAIEKALMQSTISAARRRTRSILHLTVGIDGQWEPEPEMLDSITSQFQASEEDPVGAIIATRRGVEANEIRSGGDFWKISEEADYLKTSKLNAFGLSETFLTGEASYNTMDATLSVLIENIKVLRNTLEKKVFEDKYFGMLARSHGFVKRKEADRAHGVRTSLASKSLEEGMKIPHRDLVLPKINWTKTLAPVGDSAYIEILKSLQEQGMPISMKQWASVGGMDLADVEQGLEEDKQIRARFKKYKPAPPPGEEGGGDGGFGAFSNFIDTDAVMVLGSFVNHDDHKRGTFFGVSYKEMKAIALDLTSNNKKMGLLRDNQALSSYLNTRLDSNELKVNAVKYMLTRMNLARARVSEDFVEAMANKLTITCSGLKDKKKLRALKTEVEILTAIHALGKDQRKSFDRNAIASALKEELKNAKYNTPTAMYAGV